jgi:hypothetical protein
MPPRSALLISDLPPPIPALQRVFDEGAARRLRKAAEASSDKTAKNLPGGNAAGGPKNPSATAQIPPPSFATQVFLQLPFLRTRRSSNFEVLVYSEQTLAERQADFHRSLYARLDEAEQGQEDHEQWLAMQVEVVFSPLGDLPARTQYISADDSPLTSSQIELVQDEVDKNEVEDEDDGPFLSPSPPEQPSKKTVSNSAEGQCLSGKPRYSR